MATLHTVAPPAAQTVRNSEVENRFFVGMSILLLATVLVGFAESSFWLVWCGPRCRTN